MAGVDNPAVKKENRGLKWAMFIFGNIISFAVVVFEISTLSVCFEENLRDDDDPPEERADSAYSFLLIALVLGLLIDTSSAMVLSKIYESPLDIKSVHKIPPEDMRQCGGTVMIYFLAPLFWGLVYVVGGIASHYYGQNAPCGGGNGGESLRTYLVVSGVLMAIFVVGMLGFSVVMLLLAGSFCLRHIAARYPGCSVPGCARLDGCCTIIRGTLYEKILAKSAIYDLVWQLQGVILSYRAGAFGVAAAVSAGIAGVFGEYLAAVGSLAPIAVEQAFESGV